MEAWGEIRKSPMEMVQSILSEILYNIGIQQAREFLHVVYEDGII